MALPRLNELTAGTHGTGRRARIVTRAAAHRIHDGVLVHVVFWTGHKASAGYRAELHRCLRENFSADESPERQDGDRAENVQCDEPTRIEVVACDLTIRRQKEPSRICPSLDRVRSAIERDISA